jgi:hypothetical protein
MSTTVLHSGLEMLFIPWRAERALEVGSDSPKIQLAFRRISMHMEENVVVLPLRPDALTSGRLYNSSHSCLKGLFWEGISRVSFIR